MPEFVAHEAHKYKRVILKPSGKVIYKCMLPGCAHYLSKEMVEGRIGLCWRCAFTFVISKRHLENVKIHCDTERCKNEHKKNKLMARGELVA